MTVTDKGNSASRSIFLLLGLSHMTDFEQGQEILMSAEVYSGLVTRRAIDAVLRLWSYPSFEPYKSWTIFRDNKDYYVRRIVWDQRTEQFSINPTTYGTEKKVRKEPIDHLLNDLETINISPFVNSSGVGIDGVISGIEFGTYMVSARISWWCDQPTTWKPLQLWHEKAITQLDGFLPTCTTDLVS